MRNVSMALALALGLTGAGTAWAEGQSAEKSSAPDKSQDPDQGTLEDILQSPAEETFGAPSDESKPEAQSQPGQDADQGTVEDTLQSPAEETFGEMADQAEEAVVPSSGQVAGTVKSLDFETGYFSVDTAQGAIELHADPKLLKDKGVKEGDQVQAAVEKMGEMNHVTSLMKGKSTK